MPSNQNPNWDFAFRVQSDTSNLKYLHAIPIYNDQDSLKHIMFLDHYSTNYALLVVDAHFTDSTSLYNYLQNNDIEDGYDEISQFIHKFNDLANCAGYGETAQVRCPDPDCPPMGGDTFWDNLGQFFAGLWDRITEGGSSSGSGGIIWIIFDYNTPPSDGPSSTTSGGGGGSGQGDAAFCEGQNVREVQDVDEPLSFIDQFINTYNLPANLKLKLLGFMKSECVGTSSNTCLLRSIGCQYFDGSYLSAEELGQYWLDCYEEVGPSNNEIDECMMYKEEFHNFINTHMNNISVSELQSIVGLSCYDSASGELDEECVMDEYNANIEPNSDGIIDVIDINNPTYSGNKENIPSCIKLDDGTTIDVNFGVTSSDNKSADQAVANCLIDALVDALECVTASYTITSIHISSTTNGKHSSGSNHYKSLAIDLSRINGTKMILMNQSELQVVEELQNCLENYSGIRENFGPFLEMKENNTYNVSDHSSHIHFSVNSDHTCSGFDINDISCN